MRTVPNLAIFVSGSGTLLEAMIKAKLPIKLVLADKECRGIEIARAAKIKTVIVYREQFGFRLGKDWSRIGFTLAVVQALEAFQIDLVAMAGFMTVLSPDIFTDFHGHILNIHPALLPKYVGANAVRDTLEAGEIETGSTIHIATPVLDDATYVIACTSVGIEEDDDVATLHERIKVAERPAYVDVLRQILEGDIDLDHIIAAANTGP